MTEWTRQTRISAKTRETVLGRDNHRCVLCWELDGAWTNYDLELAHIVKRSRGGRGIETNLVTLCREHHREFDESAERDGYMDVLTNYLTDCYGDWNEKDQVFRKWQV